MPEKYVHGYSVRERERLEDQAATLTELLHSDTAYPPGSLVLEAGCGVGAQTVALLPRSPGARIVSVDISIDSLRAARERVAGESLTGARFARTDLFALPFAPGIFDHVFLCFVLEHLPHPEAALETLKTALKPGGTITVIEGDHGSAYFHPDNADAQRCIHCLEALQADMGGDSLIGRRLFPLLRDAGFEEVSVSPRMVYVDGSRPALIEGFTKNTFTAMVEGVREAALAKGMMPEEDWDRGIRALYRTAETDGVFCYTFFKGVALKR